ncbi:hypothetical protein BASA83_002035 [Batrachochytrium salamandrivorans]|nr:hypothetical protein BASA83_002035 [Batrachochytrium salamandrivorans]
MRTREKDSLVYISKLQLEHALDCPEVRKHLHFSHAPTGNRGSVNRSICTTIKLLVNLARLKHGATFSYYSAWRALQSHPSRYQQSGHNIVLAKFHISCMRLRLPILAQQTWSARKAGRRQFLPVASAEPHDEVHKFSEHHDSASLNPGSSPKAYSEFEMSCVTTAVVIDYHKMPCRN